MLDIVSLAFKKKYLTISLPKFDCFKSTFLFLNVNN